MELGLFPRTVPFREVCGKILNRNGVYARGRLSPVYFGLKREQMEVINLKKLWLLLLIVSTACFHWSCEKDTVTPTSIVVAKKLGIPLNLFSLVLNYHCANCHNPSAGPALAGVT